MKITSHINKPNNVLIGDPSQCKPVQPPSFNSLEDWQATFELYTGDYPPLYIYDEKFKEFGIDDRHPTKFTPQLVHDSILEKIQVGRIV